MPTSLVRVYSSPRKCSRVRPETKRRKRERKRDRGIALLIRSRQLSVIFARRIQRTVCQRRRNVPETLCPIEQPCVWQPFTRFKSEPSPLMGPSGDFRSDFPCFLRAATKSKSPGRATIVCRKRDCLSSTRLVLACGKRSIFQLITFLEAARLSGKHERDFFSA